MPVASFLIAFIPQTCRCLGNLQLNGQIHRLIDTLHVEKVQVSVSASYSKLARTAIFRLESQSLHASTLPTFLRDVPMKAKETKKGTNLTVSVFLVAQSSIWQH